MFNSNEQIILEQQRAAHALRNDPFYEFMLRCLRMMIYSNPYGDPYKKVRFSRTMIQSTKLGSDFDDLVADAFGVTRKELKKKILEHNYKVLKKSGKKHKDLFSRSSIKRGEVGFGGKKTNGEMRQLPEAGSL